MLCGEYGPHTSLFVCPLRHASISDWVKRLYNPRINMSSGCQVWLGRCQKCYNRAMRWKTDRWQVEIELVILTCKMLLWWEPGPAHPCLGWRPWGGWCYWCMFGGNRWVGAEPRQPRLVPWVPSTWFSWMFASCPSTSSHQSMECHLWHSANIVNINVTLIPLASAE